MNQLARISWGGLCPRCRAQLSGESVAASPMEESVKLLGERLIDCETALRMLDPTSQLLYWQRWATGGERPPQNLSVTQ